MDGHTNSEQKDDEVPEDVDVSVLVSQLRARVNILERENQQVKEHTKQQSRQIQIMKQQEEGIEVRAAGSIIHCTNPNSISDS